MRSRKRLTARLKNLFNDIAANTATALLVWQIPCRQFTYLYALIWFNKREEIAHNFFLQCATSALFH